MRSPSRVKRFAPEHPYHVRSVQRAIRLLKCFSVEIPELQLKELSQAAGLSLSTTLRLLLTLESEQMVEVDKERGKYRLGVACLNLGSVFLKHAELRTRTYPVLEELRESTRETVHLAIMDRMEAVYLEKLESPQPVAIMSSRVGARLPAHCTGLGKLLLSHEDPGKVEDHFRRVGLRAWTPTTITTIDGLMEELSLIRMRGYAIDNEEHEAGVKCIAAPIRDHGHRVVAAISVAGPAERISSMIEHCDGVSVVLQAAAEASRLLGFVPETTPAGDKVPSPRRKPIRL